MAPVAQTEFSCLCAHQPPPHGGLWGPLHQASTQLYNSKWHTSPAVPTRGIAWTNCPCRVLIFALGPNYDAAPNILGHIVKHLQNHRGTNCIQGMSSAKQMMLSLPPASVAKVAISNYIYSTKIPAVPVPFLRSLSALRQMHLLPIERFISELRLCQK